MKLIGFVITLLIVAYFVIDYSASNFSLNVGGANVPVYQTKDVKTIYTNSCNNNYNTFKHNSADYKTTNQTKLFNLIIPSDISFFEIGYTDNAIACAGSGLSNSITLSKHTFNTTNDDSYLNLQTYLTIPANKHIYIYSSGSNASINAFILDSSSIVD